MDPMSSGFGGTAKGVYCIPILLKKSACNYCQLLFRYCCSAQYFLLVGKNDLTLECSHYCVLRCFYFLKAIMNAKVIIAKNQKCFYSPGSQAIILNGPPEPFLIFIGKATTYEPLIASCSRLATFSNAGILAPINTWCVLKSVDWP